MKTLPPMQDGEGILWHGRPQPILQFGMGAMAASIFAAALMLAALGLATVINRSAPGNFWTILAPALVLGCVIIGAGPALGFLRDRRTQYTMTNKRAFIIGAGNPRQTAGDRQGYPLPDVDGAIIEDAARGTVWFAHRPNGAPVGFERIADAPRVYDMMQKMAKARADA